jgi:hypothetical protein
MEHAPSPGRGTHRGTRTIVVAVIAGFLLTAAGNWTGRETANQRIVWRARSTRFAAITEPHA